MRWYECRRLLLLHNADIAPIANAPFARPIARKLVNFIHSQKTHHDSLVRRALIFSLMKVFTVLPAR